LAVGNNGRVYIATKNGLYQSSDNGGNWKLMDSFSNRMSNFVTVSATGNIFATQFQSISEYRSQETLYRSTDGGITWIKTGWTHETSSWGLKSISWLEFNQLEHLFAWKSMDGLYRSVSRGNSWVKLFDFPPQVVSLIAPDDIFMANWDGVFRSDDNGNSWVKVLAFEAGLFGISVTSLTFNSDKRIFAGIDTHNSQSVPGANGLIYYSDDDGDSWIKSVELDTPVTHLAVNSKDHIFANVKRNGIIRSTNNGLEWNKVSINFPKVSVQEFIIGPADDLFVETWDNHDHKVYRSTDEGFNWKQIWP
jgi:hypothetical protein